MVQSHLRIYREPESGCATLDEAPHEHRVRVRLGQVLPLLADAVHSRRTWLRDFADDEVELSADLLDVLRAYKFYHRPSA